MDLDVESHQQRIDQTRGSRETSVLGGEDLRFVVWNT